MGCEVVLSINFTSLDSFSIKIKENHVGGGRGSEVRGQRLEGAGRVVKRRILFIQLRVGYVWRPFGTLACLHVFRLL